MNENKSSRYHRLKRRSAILSLGLTVLLLVALLVSGASVAIAGLSRSLAHAGPAHFSALAVAIEVVLLVLLQEVFAFPIGWYQGFVLERRYGLSIEHPGTWLGDHTKAMGIGLLLSIVGAEIVSASLTFFPVWWWVSAAVLFIVALVLLAKLAPIVLLPLFYSFAPLQRDSLRARLVSLSERAGVPVLGVYEWALGEKSRRANAALVGTGATRRIILSDTLLAEYSDEEIEVILAHEMGHHVHRDILVALVAQAALLVGAFYVAALALERTWQPLGFQGPSDIAGLPLLVLAGGAVTVVATPFVHALSRWNERRADWFALTLTGRPGAFISAMKRLGNQNLAEEHPSRAVLWLFHSHPPVEQRIKAAESFL